MAAVMLNSRLSMSPPEQMTEEDKFQERKRDILVLVMRFLADYGYLITYQSLCAEASMTLDQVDAADNIDLMTIVQEFVDYYHSKFGRYPKLIRHNFPPPVAYQMQQQISNQQLPQAAMQEMHALQMQAAAAATAAAAVVSSQQQQQQQQAQQMTNPGGPQTLLPPSLLVSQAQQVLPAPVSAAMATAMDCSMSLGMGNNAAAGGSAVAGQEAAGTQQIAQQQALQQLIQQQQGSLLARGSLCWIPKEKRDRQHTNLANMEGSTKQLGSTEPLDQDGLVAILQKAQPSELPSKYLDFRYPVRPKAVKAGAKAKRPDKLAANDIQEEVMYALVGCTDIGWSSRNLNDRTREFLQQHYSIDRVFISTFFKNRSQRCKPFNQPYAMEGRRPRSTPLSLALGRSSSSSTGSKGSTTVVPATSEQNNQVATGPTAAAAVVMRSAGGVPSALQVGADPAAAAASIPCTSRFAAATSRSGLSGSVGVTTTAAAAAAMAAAAVSDSGYGSLESFGLGSPPSLPGLSSAMSLPGCLDNDNYLRSISSDLDAAADMGLGEAPGGCISPCGFSA